ncbi:MAG: hypothetical protein DRO65_00085 [Candidatus Altiarchaeales archaeon]|nr:MAG: hypothetical protein DRO65_00085 [Candidatus Altiarchaeales archaeon]HDD64180.1 hypothetical protein [Thermoprotei archaeon]
MLYKKKHDKVPYRSYNDLKRLVLYALMKLVKKAKGSCVTFTSKKIAITAGLPVQPILLTVIRDILDGLCDNKLILRYSKSSHGIKYMIVSTSPLWKYLKSLSDFQEVEVYKIEKIGEVAISTK